MKYRTIVADQGEFTFESALRDTLSVSDLAAGTA